MIAMDRQWLEAAVLHVRTPLTLSEPLSRLLPGTAVYLKMENLQLTSTFKDRGIGNRCRKAAKNGSAHIVCSSGGNAGLAAAHSARVLGMKATICVPETSPQATVEKLQLQGATVEVIGKVWDEADQRARQIAQQPDITYISPFDHPDIWEGHSTMVEEIRDQLEGRKPGAVVLSVGGGGLFCGVVEGLKKVGWDAVPVVTMETVGADSLHASIEAKQLITIPDITSVAKSLGSKRVAQQAYAYSTSHPVISELVTDQQAVSACLHFADDHRMLVEPACGASLAAVYSGTVQKLRTDGRLPGSLDSVVIIVCGGNSVSLGLLDKWKTQFNL